MSKLIIEFDDDKARDMFLSGMSRQGEQVIMDDAEENGFNWSFDYKKAFKAWGWNGKGNPTIIVTSR